MCTFGLCDGCVFTVVELGVQGEAENFWVVGVWNLFGSVRCGISDVNLGGEVVTVAGGEGGSVAFAGGEE